MEDLKNLEKSGKYEELISTVSGLIGSDKRVLENSYIKSWLGKRWRNIFISEAAKDEDAVYTATSKKLFGGTDSRSSREKVASKFLKGEGPDEFKIEMPDALGGPIDETLIFCPGLLSGLLPVMAFKEEFPVIEKEFPIKVVQSDSHPMRTCEANMADLLKAIDEGKGLQSNTQPILDENAAVPKDLFIIAYSKGMADTLVLLSKRPDLKNRIKCIFNWAGAPGGSYLANSLYESIKDIHIQLDLPIEVEGLLKLISPVIQFPDQIKRLSEYDIRGAMHDLTTTKREEFLDSNLKNIDALNIPIFNLTGSTTPFEVPYFQIQGVLELNKYDANNDMQVTQKHSKVNSPIATDLAMLHGHHWDLSYGPFPKNMRFGSPNLEHRFPRKAALSSMIKFAKELGLLGKK
jgi:hypothetical protein